MTLPESEGAGAGSPVNRIVSSTRAQLTFLGILVVFSVVQAAVVLFTDLDVTWAPLNAVSLLLGAVGFLWWRALLRAVKN